MTQECHAQSGEVELNDDSGRSWVITRRDGSQHTVTVSPEDYDRVRAMPPWCLMVTKTGRYVVTYVYHKDGSRTCVYLHRFVMDAPRGTEVDHANRDTLDNRRSNLRVCSRRQNAYNRPVRSDSVSGRKGVVLHRKSGLWRADIKADGRRFGLGYFKNVEDAAMAYEGASLLLHGEFSRVR